MPSQGGPQSSCRLRLVAKMVGIFGDCKMLWGHPWDGIRRLREPEKFFNHHCALEASPWFAGGSKVFLNAIVSQLSLEVFLEGQVIMRAGDYGDMVYFLTSGTVEVLVGSREERVATFTPGTLFGEKAIFGNGLRTATVRALELSECRVISVLALLHILECFP